MSVIPAFMFMADNLVKPDNFIFSPSWKLLLKDMGLDMQSVTCCACLPDDIFEKKRYYLSPDQYFRFWNCLFKSAKGRNFSLLFAQSIRVESFNTPIYSSFFSTNLNAAVLGLSRYVDLIAPAEIAVNIDRDKTKITILCFSNDEPIPPFLGVCQAAFFTQLARLATREHIKPVKIVVLELPEDTSEYELYFGCQLVKGNEVSISFSANDAITPFLTSNTQIYESFEESLKQQLVDLATSTSISAKVRALLIESNAISECNIEVIACKLAMSKRTLQRKLCSERANYQQIMQVVRCELAEKYLRNLNMTIYEISILLGFSESSAFIRAFISWKGLSPSQYRERF